MCLSRHTRKQTLILVYYKDWLTCLASKVKNKTLVLAQLMLAQHPRELLPGLHPHFYGAAKSTPLPMC